MHVFMVIILVFPELKNYKTESPFEFPPYNIMAAFELGHRT